MSLDAKISAFLKSNEGKQKITEAKTKVLKEGRTFGQSGTAISKEDAIRAAIKQRDILLRRLEQVGLGTITAGDIVIGEPVVDKNGNLSVDISFDSESLFRPSLAPDEYKGVENIVLHFTHGWDARGAVYGYWESAGRDTWSRSYFAGDDFMQQAVDDFNALGFGTAELNEKYL